ncbi:nuclear transport factor 2 family protein [Streptomyces sp. NPDC020681]|uniref:nuclear transport factor 2 family protein n=1 Tax=Streptomyces sp. NPDC020681 TaxID=3365083 RepID=UPI0037A6994E
MYHRIVATKIRRTFADMSAGKPQSLASAMAPTFTYRFYGDHALSGERHTLDALRRWAERGARLIPDPRFRVDEVIVTGPPWATRVATRVSVSAELPGGSRYENVFMQFMHLRWAKITEVRTLEDTAVLERALDTVAASGVAEAHAAPISD